MNDINETPRTDRVAIELNDEDRRRLGVDWESAVDGEFTNSLERENGDMLAALKEIAKGEGAFSRDQLTFASNVIENTKRIAEEAIKKAQHDQFNTIR